MDPEPLRRLSMEEVVRKKDELEAELATLNSVLKSVSERKQRSWDEWESGLPFLCVLARSACGEDARTCCRRCTFV